MALEGDLFVAWASPPESSGSCFAIALGAQEFEAINANNRFAAFFPAIAIGPTIQFEAADDAEE